MPGIIKIGMTRRTPEERLREANGSDTWRPPAPYQCIVSKRVRNPLRLEQELHAWLTREGRRERQAREFFRVTEEEVRGLFGSIRAEEPEGPEGHEENGAEEEEKETYDPMEVEPVTRSRSNKGNKKTEQRVEAE